MAVRGEEVATSIEAHVRESIDKMVAEIRSSIEDVREVVDSQLKAALQSVQADVNSITFLPHIQKSIGELEESFKPEPVEMPAPQMVAGGPDASRVKNAVQAVERGKSQVDVLNTLLEECLQFGSRAALLILRGETFSGWKGVGFTAAGGNDENVKRFNAAPGLIPELDTVLRDEHVVIWDGSNLSTRLGVPSSTRAILVPMVIKDKVAAAVYVDAIETDIAKLDAPSVELLVFTTGLLIDTLALRKKTPSPSLSEEGTAAGAIAPAPVAAPAPRPAPPAPAPAPPAPAPAPAPPPRPVAPPPAAPMSEPQQTATMRFDAAQIKELMASASPAPKFNVPSAEEFSSPTPPPRPAPAPAPAPPPTAPPTNPSVVSEERPTTQYVPPAGVGRGAAFQSPQTEDAKKHDEARRFARLLVSEIKLYNESKVEQGRKNRDLYERLKEDIDRSRQMYDDRIADEVRKSSNYFYDELVRILADGNADALGL